MNHLRNENGGAMMFVLMIIAVLIIATPVVIQLTQASYAAERQYEHAVKANHLAVSGVESFLQYLKEAENAEHLIDAFNAYTGWGTKTLRLPEGGLVKLTQSLEDRHGSSISLPIESLADVSKIVVQVEAGSGRSKRVKQIVYGFQTNESCTIISTEKEYVIDPQFQDSVIVENRYSDNVSGIVNEMSGLQQAIHDHLMVYVNDIESKMSQYGSTAQTCTSCRTLQQIKNYIENSDSTPEQPLVLRVSNIQFNQNEVITLGSSAKPVILLADNLTIDRNNTGLTVYGDLMFLHGINANQSANLTVRAVNEATGNLLIDGGVNFNGTNNSITADRTFYAKSMNLNQNLDLRANRIISSGRISVMGNNTNLIAADQMIAQSISVQRNHTVLSVEAGDLFVSDDLTSLAQHTAIVTGGMIAVGDNFDMQRNQFTIESGSTGKTSLNLDLITETEETVSCENSFSISRLS